MAEKKYIELEAAKKAACKALCTPGAFFPDDRQCCEVEDVFDAIPAADVRPVVRAHYQGLGVIEMKIGCKGCSNCGEIVPLGHFCYNCGADMGGSNNDRA